MNSDEKDFSNPADQDTSYEDIIDAEAVETSVEPMGDDDYAEASDLESDFGEDDDTGFADDDEDEESAAPQRDMKKFMVPGMILGAALLVGGFMVMGGGKGQPSAPPAPAGAEESWEQQGDAAVAGFPAGDDSLPQPAANMNQPGAMPTEYGANQDPYGAAPNAAGNMPVDAQPGMLPGADPNMPQNAGLPPGQPNSQDMNAPGMDPNAVPPPSDAAAMQAMGGMEPPPMGGQDSTGQTMPDVTPDAMPQQMAQADQNSPGYSRDTSAIFEMPPDAQPPAPTTSPSAAAPAFPPANAAVAQPPPTQTAQPVQPSSDELFPLTGGSPTVPGAPSAVPSSASAQAAGSATAPVDPSQVTTPQPDRYYDGLSSTLPDNATMAQAMGPRKVDPVLEPASKFVVVEKTREADETEAQLVSANRALKLGRYDAAVEMFERLNKVNRRDPRILMGLAVAYQNMGRDESAIKSYENLLDVTPNNADALVNMLGLLRKQYPDVALRRLMNLYSKYPNNAGIAAQIGITQGGLGETDDALRYLSIASSIEPRNAQHMFNMAVVMDRAGRRDEAINHYQRALETDSVYGGGRSIPRAQIYDRLSVLRQR